MKCHIRIKGTDEEYEVDKMFNYPQAVKDYRLKRWKCTYSFRFINKRHRALFESGVIKQAGGIIFDNSWTSDCIIIKKTI